MIHSGHLESRARGIRGSYCLFLESSTRVMSSEFCRSDDGQSGRRWESSGYGTRKLTESSAVQHKAISSDVGFEICKAPVLD